MNRFSVGVVMNRTMSAHCMRVFYIEPAERLLKREVHTLGDFIAHVIAYNVREEYSKEYACLTQPHLC